jgi:hypothetical protein
MITLEKEYVILWEAESAIKTKLVKHEDHVEQRVQKFMQDEPYYGDPDYSYY